MSDEILVKTIRITNENGLHARPAALLVQSVAKLDCEITIEKDGTRVDGKSIMGVLMLAAEHGSQIVVTTRGPDARRAVQEVEQVVGANFD